MISLRYCSKQPIANGILGKYLKGKIIHVFRPFGNNVIFAPLKKM